MKLLKLTKGKYSKVDDEDFEILNNYKWYATKSKKRSSYYAKRDVYSKLGEGRKIKKSIHLHRFITNCPDGSVVDHLDRDGLNNQKSNLKICSFRENCSNKSNSKKYMGVYKTGKKFVAKITITIGIYEKEIDAAQAYLEYTKQMKK